MKTFLKKILFLLTLICLAAAFAFFVNYLLRQPHAVEADFAALETELSKASLTDGLKAGTERLLKRNFDLLPGTGEEILYLTAEDFMDVSELLLVKADEDQQETILEGIERRLTNQKNMFENYGTNQFSLLQEAKIYQNEMYICFAAGPNADGIMECVRRAIER